MTQQSASFQERVARLRATFVAQLPSRCVEAHRLLSLLEQAAPAEAEQPLRDLHRLFHTVKGTGASFGLQAVSLPCREAEELLKRCIEEGRLPDALLLAEAAHCLARLEQVTAGLEGEVPASPAPVAAPAVVTAAPEAPKAEGKLVYVCDDDPAQLEQLRTHLPCFGYRLEAFSTVGGLRQAVAHCRPAAVILEVVFSEGEGLELQPLRELQESAEGGLPILFISERRDFQARLRAVQAGGQAFFTKPVKALELVEAMDNLTSPVAPEPFRVLLVDDEPEIAAYHALMLEEAGMSTRVVLDPTLVLDALGEFNPDLVLMDVYMPQCTGRELARVMRQMPDYLSLPILYLSSETDTQKQYYALKEGADGFLTKPVDRERLVRSVMVRAERFRAVRTLMVRDGLTGLFNHTASKQYLDGAVASAQRRGSQVCFAMIDVDRFKLVNDTYGHPVGDQVLVALSRMLQQRLRVSDLVGRYGGEEFAVVLNDLTLAQAAKILDLLREDFAKLRFYSGGREFSVTFSAGLAGCPDIGAADELCEAADKALYRAKHGGRNRVTAITAAMLAQGDAG